MASSEKGGCGGSQGSGCPVRLALPQSGTGVMCVNGKLDSEVRRRTLAVCQRGGGEETPAVRGHRVLLRKFVGGTAWGFSNSRKSRTS